MNQLLKHSYSPFLFLSPQRVRFLLSVADEYESICPAPCIYYNPVTYQPTFMIDRLHQEYRADFLIRHRKNGKAFLVELLPASMVNDNRLTFRRRVAQNYIAWKGYDWQYQCLFQEYIVLNANESLLFNSYCQMKTDNDRKKWLIDYLSMSALLKQPLFQSPNYSLLDFLIHGILPKSL